MNIENNKNKTSKTVSELLQGIKTGIGAIYGHGYADCVKEIEPELNEIIDLQESFMLNPVFKVYISGTPYTFEYEEGMSWEQWCLSKYNTMKFFCTTMIVYTSDFKIIHDESTNVEPYWFVSKDTVYRAM